MLEEELRERTRRYIAERRCRRGGYCFYRLDEPNGSDTYHAIATLYLLGVTHCDSTTVQFLQKIQAGDGTYHNLYHAYYAIMGLRLMGETPLYDPGLYLRSQLHHFTVANAASETILRRLDLLTELCNELQIEISSSQRDGIVSFILSFRGDGGFGTPVANLLASAHAVNAFKRLQAPLHETGIGAFLKRCEHPVHGYLNVPHMAPSFLEHIHAGISIAHALGAPPRFPQACRRFVFGCQDRNGGFARTSHGLPTLSDTYLAIHALSLLEG